MVCLFLVDKISVRKFRFCTTFSSVFSYFRMIFFFDENSPRRLLGTPDRIPWSGGLTLKDDDLKFPQFKPKSLLTAFPGQSEATLDLLKVHQFSGGVGWGCGMIFHQISYFFFFISRNA
eukprot:TRINITY_DN2278_c0_g1_i19.p1 TRINITY_DN2278_c0_g1~~TRINITY_DN2278_c0_g1_i19.p1  ORF type:complete len:119 (+),score=27.19 TRINITY_DN2278_c0_g1_i19:107-463(+)